MPDSSRSFLRGFAASVTLAAVFVALGACAKAAAHPAATSPPTADTAGIGGGSVETAAGGGSVETVAGGGPVETVAAPPPAALTNARYPASPQAYAEAVLNAWILKNYTVLNNLTLFGIGQGLVGVPVPPKQHWTNIGCDGAAGTSYCTFSNPDGEEFIVQISNQLLGKPHAAKDAFLERIDFENSGVAYVKEFVEAWRLGDKARMLMFSTPGVTAQIPLGAAPGNATYPAPVCCGGLLKVVVKWGGSHVTFDVATVLLGTPHAIVGYTP